MERHAIDEANAFEMLREHSRLSNRKLVDLAPAVVDGHQATAGASAVVTRKAGTGENEAPIGQECVWSS